MKKTAAHIGDFVITGISGPRLLSSESALIARHRPAGFILFGRNVRTRAQLVRLCADLRRAASGYTSAPILAIDHEGWPVDRLGGICTGFPAAPMLGRCADPQLAYRQGLVMGRELAVLGFNVDFSPVLDLFKPGSAPVVAMRSLGADPRRVARLGAALCRGLEDGGVLCCPKHFPGIGECRVDPHFLLPRLDWTGPFAGRPDMVPFARAARDGCALMMVGHLWSRFSARAKAQLSTCSPDLLRRIAREELGFSGALVSDDMHMGALGAKFSLPQACLRALGAGMDLLLLCRPIAEHDWLLSSLGPAFRRLSLGDNGARLSALRRRLAALPVAAAGNRKKTVSGSAVADEVRDRGLLVRKSAAVPRKAPGKIALLVVRTRLVSFPGAKRLHWEAFASALKRASGLRVPVSTLRPVPALPPAARARCLSRAEKILRGGAFLFVCCDGLTSSALVRDILALAPAGRTAAVSVAESPDLCRAPLQIVAGSADAESLRLSAVRAWAILSSGNQKRRHA